MNLIITFPSTFDAMAMADLAEKRRLPGRLIPTPRSLQASCGMAWIAPVQGKDAILQVIKDSGLRTGIMKEIDEDHRAKVWVSGGRRENEEQKKARIDQNEQLLSLPYKMKVAFAKERILEWRDLCRENGKTCAVSVGGLDSITLLAFVREVLQEDIDGISVSSLEDKSIQKVHQEMGVISIRPIKSKVQVLQEYGFPVLSKNLSAKISRLQTPGDESPIIKAYMTGDEGAWGGYKHSERFKLPDKWVKLFGGLYGHFRPDMECQCAPFKVSDKCCYWLKELPANQYQEEHSIWPFLGLMQSEGGRRQYSLRMHGCNYVGKDTVRSCPFNYFSRQDLLQLALDLNIHVPDIYGEISRDHDGTLRTTRAQRTGCACCGYGIHLDGRPHHFDLLREQNPKEWEFWMYRCVKDPNTGEKFGWGRVLDYIGVGWEDIPFSGGCVGQCSIEEAMDHDDDGQ